MELALPVSPSELLPVPAPVEPELPPLGAAALLAELEPAAVAAPPVAAGDVALVPVAPVLAPLPPVIVPAESPPAEVGEPPLDVVKLLPLAVTGELVETLPVDPMSNRVLRTSREGVS